MYQELMPPEWLVWQVVVQQVISRHMSRTCGMHVTQGGSGSSGADNERLDNVTPCPATSNYLSLIPFDLTPHAASWFPPPTLASPRLTT